MAAKFLGIDVGTSSIKAAIWDPESGKTFSASSPSGSELAIDSPEPGWAEQDPEVWWDHTVRAVSALPESARRDVRAIGISYQMHGLVLVDQHLRPTRPSIIWCDSRAGALGEDAFTLLGADYCFEHLLNSPGNFTAAKLGWVGVNEPTALEKSRWAMLPGDYIASRLTLNPRTTNSGLSEMILWDFKESRMAQPVLDAFEISSVLLPSVVPTFGSQGPVSSEASAQMGLYSEVEVTYRAGDQPNNAFSLGCLDPGEVAATAGTSGVVYGISEVPVIDPDQRFNTFLHVNHSDGSPRYGLLLCVNGCGSLYSWLRNCLFASAYSYEDMNRMAAQVPAGSEGLRVYPFGNGAERILGNQNVFASFRGLDFLRHDNRHLCRAAQEGIAFALRYGIEAGIKAEVIRAGNANLFLSPVFAQTFAKVTGTLVEIWDTDGALGAAHGAAVGAGFVSLNSALTDVEVLRRYRPDEGGSLEEAYQDWKGGLLN